MTNIARDDWEAGMLLSQDSYELLEKVRDLPMWEIEMFLEALQQHLENS